LDGYQLTAAIRADEAAGNLSRTPVIALTAAALKGDAERALGAGMDDYLVKPVSIPQLISRLRHWLPHLHDALSPQTTQPQPADSHPSAIDTAALQAFSGGDRRTEDDLLDDFLVTTQQDVATLRQALGTGDLVAVRREAHRIKGAARLV